MSDVRVVMRCEAHKQTDGGANVFETNVGLS